MNKDTDDSQPHSTKYPPSRLRGLIRFKPGQSGNPGGNPKSVRVDIAYKKIIAMDEDELKSFVPKTGAELMAMEQFKRACDPKTKNTLGYAQEVTNRTDGPLIRKVQKEDTTQVQAERQRFEAAIDALVEKRRCSRSDAAIVLATINPSYKKFIIEPGEDEAE